MKKVIQSFGYALIIKISSLVKISSVMGSHILCLSGPAILAPLSGAFGGYMGAFIVFLGRMALHCALYKTLSLSFLAFCVPGLFAGLYWATHHVIIRLFVPMVCMGLFIAHPVGGQVFVYSLYWLIPVALWLTNSRSLFSSALGSTFVAHAVGSVIWLYTVPMTAEMWLALIPIVAFERLLFAVLMVVVHKAIVYVNNKIGKIFVATYTSQSAV